jgi:hypothetical protein
VSTKPKAKTSDPTENQTELVVAALNEHGFLLQQVTRQKLEGYMANSTTDTRDKWTDSWRFLAAEYPVTAADGSQTRIDMLLRHKNATGVHICMECKRPNPKFKKWIFFDRDSNVTGMHSWQITAETIVAGKRSLAKLSNMRQVPVLSYYLEAGVKRDGSVSSTEAIEKAF